MTTNELLNLLDNIDAGANKPTDYHGNMACKKVAMEEIRKMADRITELENEAKGAKQIHVHEFYEQALKFQTRYDELKAKLDAVTAMHENQVITIRTTMNQNAEMAERIEHLEASNDKYRQFKDHLPLEDIVAIEVPGDQFEDGDIREFAVHKSLKRYVESLESQIQEMSGDDAISTNKSYIKLKTDSEALESKLARVQGMFDRSQQIISELHDQHTSLRKILHAVAKRALPGTTDLDIHVLFRDDVNL